MKTRNIVAAAILSFAAFTVHASVDLAPNAPDYSKLVAATHSVVVNIHVTEKAKASDPLSKFLGGINGDSPKSKAEHALGSGFIIRSDGLILTNAHVVNNASEVDVSLPDHRTYKAKILGVDVASDIAVIKIPATGLPVAKIGDAQKLRVGQSVVAIGAPYGFLNTVTAGIVSAVDRGLPKSSYVAFIQTDVPINPGNSGGPLFNTHGEVVGINSQIYSESGGFQGLSFSIPIDTAMNVAHQLLTIGHVVRGRIGTVIRGISFEEMKKAHLPSLDGTLIVSVQKDGPAAKAGLLPDDIIVEVNGVKIHSTTQLPILVSNMTPGSQATFTIVRNGERKKIVVTIGEVK